MSLKDHLEHLVMRLGSRASTPTASGNLVSISVTANVTDYVLPSDGYVNACLMCRMNEWTGLENLTTTGTSSLAAQVLPYSTDSEFFISLFICGKKGDTVRITVNSTSDIGWLQFIPSVGEGY